MSKRVPPKPEQPRRVSLKTLAEYLQLNPSTISFVLNDAPNRSIPESTRQRVREAAEKFGYEPSHIARSLRSRRTQTIGIMLPELGDGYHSQVLNGAADVLMRENYFFFTAQHRRREDLVRQYPNVLHARGAEALLAIDTHLEQTPTLPTVVVAGHEPLPGVTNVILDHELAAEQALGHLHELGHREIAYMRGLPASSDSDTRWEATMRAAKRLKLRVRPELIITLEEDSHTPELGYPGVKRLLERTRSFTAVLCFNDISAIGTVRALADAGLRVPHDCSVMGFDDIAAAAYQTPRLTTICQPLQRMGEVAATLLLKKIAGEPVTSEERVEPELIVRESTGPVPKHTPR